MSIENINIAILGPVSAGKSTFFNALCSNTCSDMKRKKTTMLPQIYNTTDDDYKVDSIDVIYNKNKISNEEILIKRESNKFNHSVDFKEINHTIKTIPDFIHFDNNNTSYSILDMPGLNDGGNSLYYDYIKQNSHKIDIYILVFDINSGLNTTDEVNIINMVVEEIIKNKNGYIHVIINKCDEITFNKNKIILEDEELNELYERSLTTIQNLCSKVSYSVSPLCSSKLYIFRSVKNNIDDIDESQLDTLIKEQCGKLELKKLKDIKMKKKFISGLLNKSKNNMYDDWMTSTGYNKFKESINMIIKNNYDIIIYKHIEYDLSLLHSLHTYSINVSDNIDDITEKLKVMVDRISNLKKSKPQIIISKIDEINQIISTYIKNGVNTYSGSTIENCDSYLVKISKIFNMISAYFIDSNSIKFLSESQKIIEDKKYELLKDQFIKSFNNDIYNLLIAKKKLTKDIICLSIRNTLKIDINQFNKMLLNLQDEDTNILIDIFIETYQTNKMNFDNFKTSFENILKIKNKDLKSIIKILNIYYNNNINYAIYWCNMNLSEINKLSIKIQYIFFKCFHSDKIIKNIVLDLSDDTIDNYEENINNMNNIFMLLIKYIDNNLNEENIQPINKSNNIPKQEYISESDEESEEMNNVGDNESEKYYESDNSDEVYDKASRNASIKANNIMNTKY